MTKIVWIGGMRWQWSSFFYMQIYVAILRCVLGRTQHCREICEFICSLLNYKIQCWCMKCDFLYMGFSAQVKWHLYSRTDVNSAFKKKSTKANKDCVTNLSNGKTTCMAWNPFLLSWEMSLATFKSCFFYCSYFLLAIEILGHVYIIDRSSVHLRHATHTPAQEPWFIASRAAKNGS